MFSFGQHEFLFSHIPWPEDNESFLLSQFDEQLTKTWDQAYRDGIFWYTLDDVEVKTVPGMYGMVAQLNTKRFSQRRKPDEFSHVKVPFSKDKFNFSKVKHEEILFEVKDLSRLGDNEKHVLIVNVSPIVYGHVLLVPNIGKKLPQIMDASSVCLAAQLCLLSAHRGFRVGFNSLCAMASVNHLHFHCMYISSRLPIDDARLSLAGNDLYVLVDFMVRGFALQISDGDVDAFSRRVSVVTKRLCEANIAHNAFFTRTDTIPTCDGLRPPQGSTVTAFIFPKHPCAATNCVPFNVAVLELAGFLPMGDREEYDRITEEKAIAVLNNFTFREDEFDALTNDLVALLGSLGNEGVCKEDI